MTIEALQTIAYLSNELRRAHELVIAQQDLVAKARNDAEAARTEARGLDAAREELTKTKGQLVVVSKALTASQERGKYLEERVEAHIHNRDQLHAELRELNSRLNYRDATIKRMKKARSAHKPAGG